MCGCLARSYPCLVCLLPCITYRQHPRTCLDRSMAPTAAGVPTPEGGLPGSPAPRPSPAGTADKLPPPKANAKRTGGGPAPANAKAREASRCSDGQRRAAGGAEPGAGHSGLLTRLRGDRGGDHLRQEACTVFTGGDPALAGPRHLHRPGLSTERPRRHAGMRPPSGHLEVYQILNDGG